MKKIVSTVLALSMLFGAAPIARAEEPPTQAITPEQQEARQKYLPIHLEKMTQLTDLRAQTEAAVENNNNLAKQIKEKITSQKQNQDAIASIKAVIAKNKELTAQAKNLNTQRADALKQFRDAVKSKDASAAASAKDKVLALNSQIESLRQQIKANIDSIKSQKDQLKAYRDALKSKRDQVKPLSEQAKSLREKIVSAEQAKQKLWETYKANINSKDYDSAANTLQSIIDTKANILKDIKARGEILANILNILTK